MRSYGIPSGDDPHHSSCSAERSIPMAKKEERFVKTFAQGAFETTEIWVDKVTGVNYLFHYNSMGGGMTPLLKADGTPVVTPIPRCEE